MDPRYDVLDEAARLTHAFTDSVGDRPAGTTTGPEELRARLARPLTDAGEDPRTVVADLAGDVEGGLIPNAGPRYYGFVTGGSYPVALAADWLTAAWDQNAGGFVAAPAVSVIEEVAAGWTRDLLGLPAGCSVGFVTGGQMANFTCLAAARHAVLRDAGWDVEADGLQGAPDVRVIAGEDAHVSIAGAVRMLGLGAGRIRAVTADGQGRMRPEALVSALEEHDGPTIVCAQAGELHTGAFDPLPEITAACRAHGAWCHVDGAFGLWAAASRRRRALVDGLDRADSWATDAHKWLNVPYDCGIAAVADADAHRVATTPASASLPRAGYAPSRFDGTPELSRRARGVPVYATLRALGRDGLADLIDGCCDHAVHLAELLRVDPRLEVLNDVVLNQVLVRVGDDDALTDATIDAVQRDGTCWVGGSTFGGRAVVRISIVNWQTTSADIERSAVAIRAAVDAVVTPSAGAESAPPPR